MPRAVAAASTADLRECWQGTTKEDKGQPRSVSETMNDL